MEKDLFLQEIIPLIQELVPSGFTVVEKVQMKNNGTIRSGLTLKKETGRGTFPFVYIDPLYEAFLQGCPLEELALDTAHRLCEKAPGHPFSDRTPTADEVRRLAVFRLVNRDRNDEFLREIVSRDFLDLSLLYGLYSENEAGESTVFFMKKALLPALGLTEEELFSCAFRNSLRCFGETLEGIHERILPAEGEEWMYILTNRFRLYGAAALIYGSALKKLAGEKGRDILVLPSSIHELILTPLEEGPYDYLDELIKTVNDSSTAPEDVLSDHAYVYRRETDRIEIFRA